jgi:hypothetical protein
MPARAATRVLTARPSSTAEDPSPGSSRNADVPKVWSESPTEARQSGGKEVGNGVSGEAGDGGYLRPHQALDPVQLDHLPLSWCQELEGLRHGLLQLLSLHASLHLVARPEVGSLELGEPVTDPLPSVPVEREVSSNPEENRSNRAFGVPGLALLP